MHQHYVVENIYSECGTNNNNKSNLIKWTQLGGIEIYLSLESKYLRSSN